MIMNEEIKEYLRKNLKIEFTHGKVLGSYIELPKVELKLEGEVISTAYIEM